MSNQHMERLLHVTDPISRTLSTATLVTADRHFNATLFDGTLPACVLTAVACRSTPAHPRRAGRIDGTGGTGQRVTHEDRRGREVHRRLRCAGHTRRLAGPQRQSHP